MRQIAHLAPGCQCEGKRCERCNLTLCHLAFGLKRTGLYGLREKCKTCHRAARDEKREQRKLQPTRPAPLTPERLAELRAMPYAQYLQSPEWQRRRATVFRFASGRCQICYSDQGEKHVHHRTYERLGCERISDTILLCADCHKLFHEHGRLHKVS